MIKLINSLTNYNIMFLKMCNLVQIAICGSCHLDFDKDLSRNILNKTYNKFLNRYKKLEWPKPHEQKKIAGFDFSRLEQWEETRLNVDLADGKWTASVAKANPKQNEMNEWFDSYWRNISVLRVEPYTPDRKTTYPSFEVKLSDGNKVHLDKIQESPELLLGRPDEGMMYHVPPDIGFTLLNPPINLGK
jgi:hypothetical protein